MSMQEHVTRYVAHKRSLGCKFASEECLLLSWADAAMTSREDIIRADAMIRWSRQTSSNDQAHRRLAIGRRFALWLRAEDERHEVPHKECLGRFRNQQRTPILLSDGQIRGLMEAALQLPPAGSITPHTIHTIVGLVAVTGLRRAEVCALRLTDVTEDGLVIRETKFAKSRLVPLSDSTRAALDRYLGRRRKLDANCDRVFVLSTGKPIGPDTLSEMFRKLAHTAGLRGGKGERGVTLHQLRHRFAVRSLEQATATDRDSISRHILALSTYMGHVSVSSTYWYIHATPVLLRAIAEKAEELHTGKAAS